MATNNGTSFPILDPAFVASALAAPPFVSIDGVFNIRDFGAGYPTVSGTSRVKPLRLFRSGELARITDTGIQQLRSLGIQRVFDLRVDSEIAKYGTASKLIDGVELVRVPIIQDPWRPSEVPQRLKEFEQDATDAFLQSYKQVLLSGSTSLERILVHLCDQPDVPCLIHCTAGKDRTGVFAAAILMLLGARDEHIIADYALTEVGLQPALPMLAVRFQNDPIFRENWTGTVAMGSSKAESMRAFIDHIRQEYGGIEGYIRTHTKLADDDLRRIRENLLA
ncbi:protein-tyrosine phosphatase-like protein [Cubamyces lactineus]|nr:protein-tyrosine phosphatase-like protein [Cubamyces lactineus]